MAQPQPVQRFPYSGAAAPDFLEDVPELQPDDPVVDSSNEGHIPSKDDTFQPTDVY
jgi:hypothetical protein